MTSFRMDLFERCFPEPMNSAGPILGSGCPIHVEPFAGSPGEQRSRAWVPAALTSLSLGP